MRVLFIEPREVLYSGGNVFPDAIQFLEGVKKKFALVALTDDGQEAVGGELESYNLLGYFEMIMSSKEYDMKKPDYRLVNISLATLRDRFGEEAAKSGCALVGCKPYEDIKCGNDAGIKTIRIMRGVYANREPEDDSEKPAAKVADLKEALYVLAPEEAELLAKAEKVEGEEMSGTSGLLEEPAPSVDAPKPGKKAKRKKKAKKKGKRISKKQIEAQFA